MYDIITQAIGIVAAAATIFSYQFKENKTLFFLQGVGGLLFAVNFFMLGSYTAAVFNFVNLFRGAILAFGGKRLRSAWMGVAFSVAYTVIAILSYDSWLSILILVAQLASTVTLWSQNRKWIRWGQMAIVSPAWLTNNIVCFSLGGIITEVFCFLSALVFLIRYRGGFGEKTE